MLNDGEVLALDRLRASLTYQKNLAERKLMVATERIKVEPKVVESYQEDVDRLKGDIEILTKILCAGEDLIDLKKVLIISLYLGRCYERRFIIRKEDMGKVKEILEGYQEDPERNDFDFFSLLEEEGVKVFVIGDPDEVLVL